MKISSAVMFMTAASNAAVSFNRDVRPIMSDTCFRYHGPDKSSRMAGMWLDIRGEALKPTSGSCNGPNTSSGQK